MHDFNQSQKKEGPKVGVECVWTCGPTRFVARGFQLIPGHSELSQDPWAAPGV